MSCARANAMAALCIALAGCTAVYDYPEAAPEESAARCDDGVDNDLDGKTDCADPQCEPFCGEEGEKDCHDGVDNDADGDADCEDDACAPDCVESTDATCHDEQDNDQDELTDCVDPACGAFCPESDASACADEVDNDSDGDTDCEDRDCDGHCPEDSAADCDDGRDNDGDGLADAADPRCWLLRPPRVQRCAQASGVDLVENFDLDPGGFGASTKWTIFGSSVLPELVGDSVAVQTRVFPQVRSAGQRKDLLQIFVSNATDAPTLDASNLAGMVRAEPFSGNFERFSLSFLAAVHAGELLAAGIVPPDPAPQSKPSLPPIDDALVAIILDAAHQPPTATLLVDGERVSAPLPLEHAACGQGTALCDDDLVPVKIASDEQDLVATIARRVGTPIELRAPLPRSRGVPPSQLVVWGGSTSPDGFAEMDDLRLRVAGDYPCGFLSPQIPGRSCELRDALRSFGHAVALAQDDRDRYCALVTASRDPGVFEADAVTAWTSSDGETWSAATTTDAPALELPKGARPIGAGIAHDGTEFHVAVAYRDRKALRLGFAHGRACGAWGAFDPGPRLDAEAEAPSYVITEGDHAVYFTLPPKGGRPRTLHRIVRRQGARDWSAPEQLAELPANVASPVGIRRVGSRDLVLAHPTARSSGTGSVGLLVGDAEGRAWHAVEPSPIFDLPKAPETGGSLAFDEQGVLSAAIGWGEHGGFLLYGASASPPIDPLSVASSSLAVGTARAVPAGEPFPEPGQAHVPACGDGTCDAPEACTTCPADCPCGGELLLSDVFTPDAPWQIWAERFPYPVRYQYLDFDRAALNWVGGGLDSWSVLPLDHPIAGDFELSFDAIIFQADVVGSLCSFYVGVGAVPELSALAIDGGDAIAAGAFARLSYATRCHAKYLATPFVATGSEVFAGLDERLTSVSCPAGNPYWDAEMPRHVVLRREGSRVTLHMTEDNACGVASESFDYAGALPELSALLLGFGGGPFDTCAVNAGSGTISNVRLRLLEDPGDCPDGTEVCDGEQPACVDLERSPEHCGACDHACAAHETCVDGECACSTIPGLLACDGACVDSHSDPANCGACGRVCEESCVLGACAPAPGTCAAPIALPEDGGTFTVNFAELDPTLVEVCPGVVLSHVTTFSWTPAEDVRATLSVRSATGNEIAVLAISSAEDCGAGVCTSAEDPELTGTSFAGDPTLIMVGLYAGDAATSTAELSVEIQ